MTTALTVEKLDLEEGEEMMEKFGKHFPSYLSGYDKTGAPVFVFEFGKHKFTEIPQHDTGNFLKFVHHVVINKIVKAVEENPNHGGRKMAFIVDLDGFSLRNISSAQAMSILRKLLKYAKELSPMLEYGIALNCNSAMLQIFLKIVRPFVPEVMGKFEIFGSKSEIWIPILSNKISADQLPPQYGGTADFQPVAVYYG